MKKLLLGILEKIIEKLQKLSFKFSIIETEKLGYTSLSPISDGDDDGQYSKALLWALENRKKEDIKNIALTGPYGSGKSSILKTFQKNYKGRDLKFLNISLATFKEEKIEKDEEGKIIEKEKSELLRLIETSILQQIFYHEEDKNIPDSRFKKIKSYSLIKLFITSLGYLFFLLALSGFFFPSLVKNIIMDFPFSDTTWTILQYVGIVIILLGLFSLIFKSIRIINSITINKLKFQNAEIGLGESINKSILNHHLDEILYFFSIRPYNVVIIEDLDRFQETEIFTKLREINLLLNNTKKTKRKAIVFIYAVRDDMFTDRDRTKFFDFIIPVIPVINSSNSSVKLIKHRADNGYKITDDLIEDLSFFIDDMRLLHNINNEFYLYKEKLDPTLKENKLFAIITYKNIYPNDFVELSNNKGDLYRVFNLKTSFIQSHLKSIDTEILQLKDEIKRLENLYVTNVKYLRILYVARYMEKMAAFNNFLLNGAKISLDDLVTDEKFEYLVKDKIQYDRSVSTGYGGFRNETQNIEIKFAEIEKIVDSNITYGQKEKEIIELNLGRINSIKIKIREQEELKAQTKNYKISNLLKTKQIIDLELNKEVNKDFITTLLRNGYIAEDYIDYISLFHEGSITRSDYQFLINIKNQNKLQADYKLFKIEKLIPKINSLDFSTEFVFNFNLLDFIIRNRIQYKAQLESILNKLKDESKESIEFIEGHIESSENVGEFIKILCDYWSNIWNYIENESSLLDDKKRSIYVLILGNAEVSSIEKIANQSNFNDIILDDPDFLNIISDKEKLKSIIEKLLIFFIKLDFNNSPKELLEFVYQNEYYQLNIEMVKSFIKKFGEFNQVQFDTSNYAFIKKSKAQKLYDYVEYQINEYVEGVYLKIATNTREQESDFIELINIPDLKNENKIAIIEQVETKINDLSLIKDLNFYSLLLEKNNVFPKWENLLAEFEHSKEVSDSIIVFINDVENAKELSKIKIPTKVNDKNIYGKFWRILIQRDDIENENYQIILKSNPWWYEDIVIEKLSKEKVIALIDNSVFKPSLENYQLLKQHFVGLNIQFIEKNKKDFIKIVEDLILDDDDLFLILKSSILTNQEKNVFLNGCSEETINLKK